MALLLFLSIPALSSAEIKPRRFSISPMIGGYTYDRDLPSDVPLKKYTRPLGVLKFGYDFTERWGVEVFNMAETSHREGVYDDVHKEMYRLHALYYFNPEKRLNPFLTFGGGRTSWDSDVGLSESESDWLLDYGVGLKYFMKDWVALRGDLRHLLIFDEKELLSDFEYLVGLDFYWPSRKPKFKLTVAKEGTGDGLVLSNLAGIDCGSDCSHHYAQGTGVILSVGPAVGSLFSGWRGEHCSAFAVCKVGMLGNRHLVAVFDKIPPPVVPVPQIAPHVVVPGPEVVVPVPSVPLDSDGDGIIDVWDKCPDTPLGVTMDQKGCPAAGKKIAEKITIFLLAEFDFDKWKVRPEYDGELDHVVGLMQKHPNISILLEGHTDSFGENDYNLTLSRKRVESVSRALIARGLDKSRITLSEYGEVRPSATNKNSEGRQRNRRVFDVFSGLE